MDAELLKTLVIAVLGSFIGGAMVLLVQEITHRRKEKKQIVAERTLKSRVSQIMIDTSILHELRPNANLGRMKELLGEPARQTDEDYSIFTEEDRKTNSYFYSFRNAHVKITSQDNRKIDSLTVFPYDNTVEVELFQFIYNTDKVFYLNAIPIQKELLEFCHKYIFIDHPRCPQIALTTYIPRPYYMTFAFFGYAPKGDEYLKTNDPNCFIGGTLNGLCLSVDVDSVFSIFEHEIY